MPKKKRKPAEDMTTDEAVDHLFHPDMADALRDEVAEKDDDEEDDTEE